MGNDVVDLALEENRGKSQDVRFLGRVFAPSEQALIAAAPDPDARLWALWAAKEAAFKAVSRTDPTVDSIPRHYPVSLDQGERRGLACPPAGLPVPPLGALNPAAGAAGGGREVLAGRVSTPGGVLALRVTVTPFYCHALVVLPAVGFRGVRWRVEGVEPRVADPSAQVRTSLCAAVARQFACPDGEIEVRTSPSGPGAPVLFRRGIPLPVVASLSHDGRYVAYAWASPHRDA